MNGEYEDDFDLLEDAEDTEDAELPVGGRIKRFTVYRKNISARQTHNELQKNPDSEPQFEGVIWSDETVTIRWLTKCRSTSVWNSLEDMLDVHGHPEYGTEIVWHDGDIPLAWTQKVEDYNFRHLTPSEFVDLFVMKPSDFKPDDSAKTNTDAYNSHITFMTTPSNFLPEDSKKQAGYFLRVRFDKPAETFPSSQLYPVEIGAVYDNKVFEMGSVESVAEYLESRLESLCNDSNTFYSDTIRNSPKYARFIATERARNWSLRQSRRGRGNRRYKNFVFYDGNSFFDKIFQVYHRENFYRIYENPNSKYMVAKMMEKIGADLDR